MAIEFFNIRSGERKIVETPEMISAFYNSTDQHVNARVGQDMGWRIGASTIKRMDEIRRDQATLDRIAQAFSLPQGETKDTDIINWISLEDARKKQQENQQQEGDFSAQYEEEVRRAKLGETEQEDTRVEETPSAAAKLAEQKKAQDTADKKAKADAKKKADAEAKAKKEAESNKTDTTSEDGSAKIEESSNDKES